jgi:dihydropteroate synthase
LIDPIFSEMERRGRTLLMGVLNVTPDSFSEDGLLGRPPELAARAERMVEEGADLLDIGGESTRPGHHPVSADEELRRVIPALEAVVRRVPVPVSVDTSKASVARAALAAGARIVNDVSGLRDPEMAASVAEGRAGMVVVHNVRVDPLRDLIQQIESELKAQIARARLAGVAEGAIVVDPGLGFGKDWRLNFEVVRRLRELQLGKPVLVGPSRKGMIGRVLGVDVTDRIEGTAALLTLCVAGGADVVRVHDVRTMARVARVADALVRPGSPM